MQKHATTRKSRTSPWITGVNNAAAYIGISPRTFRYWMARGIIQPKKISTRLLIFRIEHLDDAIETLAEQFEEKV